MSNRLCARLCCSVCHYLFHAETLGIEDASAFRVTTERLAELAVHSGDIVLTERLKSSLIISKKVK